MDVLVRGDNLSLGDCAGVFNDDLGGMAVGQHQAMTCCVTNDNEMGWTRVMVMR